MKTEIKIVYKNVDELKAYENNPRNNEVAVPYVKNSIMEFGFRVPIVIDKNNVVVAGHTRLEAAKELDMIEVPCVVADDLSEKQVSMFRLVDNKTHEFSKWDLSLLSDELNDIFDIDMESFGFTDISLPAVSEVKSEHEARTVCCPKCGFEFPA